MLCGLAAMTAAGCSDFEFPSWVPFQGPASDTMPGVVSPRERVEQLKKLSETAATATPAQRQQVSEQLAASIRSEKDPLIRLEIIRTLGHYPGPAADAILKAALNDPEARIRTVACEAWGKRNDAQAVALLAETLRSDVDADVRLAAAEALGETKNPAALAALGDALNDSRSGHAVSGRLVAEEGHGQRLRRERRALAAIRQATTPPGHWLLAGRSRSKPILTTHHRITSSIMSALPLPQIAQVRSIEAVRVAPFPLRICDPHIGRLPIGPAWWPVNRRGGGEPVQPIRFTEQFKTLLGVARQMTESAESEAILLLLEGPAEWSRLKSLAGKAKVVVAAEYGGGACRGQGGGPGDRSASTCPIAPSTNGSPSRCWRPWPTTSSTPGSCVVALYSGFDADTIDSLERHQPRRAPQPARPAATCGNWKPASPWTR